MRQTIVEKDAQMKKVLEERNKLYKAVNELRKQNSTMKSQYENKFAENKNNFDWQLRE